MKRRDFIARAVPVSVLPALLGGFTFRAYGRSPLIEALTAAATGSDKVLVLIQLNGGNDGLNMVIPRDQYSGLAGARSNVMIPENLVLPLTTATGLHPSLAGFQSLFQEKKAAVAQSVGYPNPNFSHFRATDIWLTGSDSNEILTSGWMGRYLAQEFEDFPNGYPNAVMPDPLAIQIGSVVSTGLQGPSVSMGMAITSPTSFYQMISGAVDVAPNTPAGHELTYIRLVSQQTQQYATAIQTAASHGSNQSPLYPVPGTNKLADQLKIVAQLVSGGLKTRIYVVNLGGFDTHSAQVDATGGNQTGDHADLLSNLSIAITAFQDDLRRLNAGNRVVGMTFSEFGRRIKSNSSRGTDHGTSAPMLFFGDRINATIHGSNPYIPANATVNDNIPMQYDFRSVYASILNQWLGVPKATLQSILLKDYQTLPLIVPEVRMTGGRELSPSKTVYERGRSELPLKAGLSQNYPNPFNPSTRIGFTVTGDPVRLAVFDMLGREVRTLVDGSLPPGQHEVVFDASDLPSGTYYCRMQSGDFQQIIPMLLAK